VRRENPGKEEKTVDKCVMTEACEHHYCHRWDFRDVSMVNKYLKEIKAHKRSLRAKCIFCMVYFAFSRLRGAGARCSDVCILKRCADS
jgi:hypothetical protein